MMNEFADMFLWEMGLASAFLAGAAVIAWGTLNVFRCRSPFVHRTTWCLVLAQSLLLLQFTIAIPWEAERPTGQVPGAVGAAANSAVAVEAVSPDQVVPESTVAGEISPLLSLVNWSAILLMVWAIGVLIVLGQWIARYIWFVRNLPCNRCEHELWNQEWSELLAERGVDARIPLYLSHNVGPLLGRWPDGQRVVVPESLWSRLPQAQRQAILRHELAHFERHDLLKTLVANLVAAMHWFNPFAWFAVRRFEDSIEWTCDHIVHASKPEARIDYAKALLALGKNTPLPTTWASAIFGGGLAGRIRRVVSLEDAPDSRFKMLITLGLLVALTAMHMVRVDLVAQEANSQSKTIISADYFIAPVVTDLQTWHLKGIRLPENEHISVYADLNGQLFFSEQQPTLDLNRFDFDTFFRDLASVRSGNRSGTTAIRIEFENILSNFESTFEMADQVEAAFQLHAMKAGIEKIKVIKSFIADGSAWQKLSDEAIPIQKETPLGNKNVTVFPVISPLGRYLTNKSASDNLRCFIDIAKVQPLNAVEALSADDQEAILKAVTELDLPKNSDVQLHVHFEKPSGLRRIREHVSQTNQDSDFQLGAVDFLKSIGFARVAINVELNSVVFGSVYD